jgi:hypothetical protein
MTQTSPDPEPTPNSFAGSTSGSSTSAAELVARALAAADAHRTAMRDEYARRAKLTNSEWLTEALATGSWTRE